MKHLIKSLVIFSFLLINCNKQEENKFSIEGITDFDDENSVEAKCGGSHFFCKSCYTTIQRYSSKCPMCRERVLPHPDNLMDNNQQNIFSLWS